MESRFWNKIEFVTPKTLIDLWKARTEIEVTPLGLFAAIANEFSNGSITLRPWGVIIAPDSILQVLGIGFVNAPYLAIRSSAAGADQKAIIRTFAYLILAALDISSAESVTALFSDLLDYDVPARKKLQEMLLTPIMNQLLSEIQDVCSSDCTRMMFCDRSALQKGIYKNEDEVDSYWLRFEYHDNVEPDKPTKLLRIEGRYKPCVVGFPVDKDNYCPLFGTEPTVKNTGKLMAVIKRVSTFRKAQAAQKRQADIHNSR